ncbi:MAG: GntR family transcriptional regulator [Candidatus Methylomirabilis sp.]|nr:GntR family transcriptional regulator [Deltaproteobacteria bacterium]
MTGFKLSVKKHQTLRERIVETVREAIIKGDLTPGERLTEPDLAERFGISRTPIREAFRQLESEGFLKVVPRKGALVTPITEKDVREFYEIKGILEGYAARRGAEKLTDKEIDRMEALNTALAKYAAEGDQKNLFRAHNEFHETFVRAAGNEKLSQLITNLVHQFQRFRIALSIYGGIQTSIEQHRDLIAAFRRRDPDAAERLARENAETGGRMLIREITRVREEREGAKPPAKTPSAA